MSSTTAISGSAVGRMEEHIFHLSGIRDRTPTTDGEARGAEMLTRFLKDLGAEVHVQEFRTFPDLPGVLSLHALIALVGGGVGIFAPAAGAGITGLASASLYQELTRKRDLLRRLLPTGVSRNVVGIFRAHGRGVGPGRGSGNGQDGDHKQVGTGPGPRRRIVLSAHIDSALTTPMFNPKFADTLSGLWSRLMSTVPALGDMAFHVTWPLGLVSLLRTIRVLRKPLLPLHLGLCAMQLPSLLFNGIGSLQHRPSPGANDNASGVAVIMEAARHMVENDWIPEGVEVWVLGTGAEEAHLQGMLNFFSPGGLGEWLSRKSDWFINLDTVGKGRLRYLESDGMVSPVKYSDASLELVARLKADGLLGDMTGTRLRLATDGQVASRKGFNTISLIALDEQQYVKGYHWFSDSFGAIEATALRNALAAVLRLVDEIASSPA